MVYYNGKLSNIIFDGDKFLEVILADDYGFCYGVKKSK